MSAMKTINVTQEDIDQGSPCDPVACPVARAITRAFKVRRVSAGLDGVTVYRRFLWDLSYPTPMRAIYFMHQFDAGHPVEPFSFTLKP